MHAGYISITINAYAFAMSQSANKHCIFVCLPMEKLCYECSIHYMSGKLMLTHLPHRMHGIVASGPPHNVVHNKFYHRVHNTLSQRAAHCTSNI